VKLHVFFATRKRFTALKQFISRTQLFIVVCHLKFWDIRYIHMRILLASNYNFQDFVIFLFYDCDLDLKIIISINLVQCCLDPTQNFQPCCFGLLCNVKFFNQPNIFLINNLLFYTFCLIVYVSVLLNWTTNFALSRIYYWFMDQKVSFLRRFPENIHMKYFSTKSFIIHQTSVFPTTFIIWLTMILVLYN